MFRKITGTSFPKAQQKEKTVLSSFLRITDSGLRFCYGSLVWLCVCAVSSVMSTLACQVPLTTGLLQARILEWVAMYSSRRSSWPRDQAHIPCISCISGGFFITEPLTAVMIIKYWNVSFWGLLRWLSSKESACSAGAAGDTGSVPPLGRDPGGAHGNPLQYSFLEDSMDTGAWWAMVPRVAKSRTVLKRLGKQAVTTSSAWSALLPPLPWKVFTGHRWGHYDGASSLSSVI